MLIGQVSSRYTVVFKFPLTLQILEQELLSLEFLIKRFHDMNHILKASLIGNLTIWMLGFLNTNFDNIQECMKQTS